MLSNITQPRLFLGFGVLVPTLLACMGLYLWNPIPVQIMRNLTFDQFQRLKPRDYHENPVRIINIDDESLARLGQWPWPRTRIAELLLTLQAAQPAAIALDIIFAEHDRTSPQAMLDLWQLPAELRLPLSHLPDHDQLLADAIRQTNTTLGFALTINPSLKSSPLIKAHFVQIGASSLPHLISYQGALTSLPDLEAFASGNGALTFISDADGVIRKVPLVLRYQDTLLPSLTAECLRLSQKDSNFTLRSQPDGMGIAEVWIGSHRIPTTANGEIRINYSKPDTRRSIPAWQVLAGNIDKNAFNQKILLIGTSAQGLMDQRFSPLGGLIPGIEIHAQALEQVLSGEQLIQPQWAGAAELLVILVGGLLIGVIALSTGVLFSFSVFLLFMTSLWWAAWHAYAHYRLLIDPMVPSVLLTLIFLTSSIFRHLYSERSQRWVKQAFSRYVSPNLVDYLISHPQELQLGGSRQTCSFVFTDLAGFTRLMEQLDPSQAVSLLNDYLENMIAIAFSHQGTLDRIVGDAVAIMFSAPVKQADHQRRAINCALDMQRCAKLHAAQLNTQGISFGQTRIGVHTGEVIVGNFGGKTIFDYRALGDAVNTASRLEGANKYLGTSICVSEATLAGCPDLHVRPIGRLLVKGKSVPLSVFEPLQPANTNIIALTQYLAAYSSLDHGHLEQALSAFQNLASDYPEDGLVHFHLQRLLNGNASILIELSDK